MFVCHITEVKLVGNLNVKCKTLKHKYSLNRISSNLIFVQLTVLELCLSLFTKSDDDKTHENVHHEEGDDDDVDNEEYRDLNTVVVNGSTILCIGINGFVE